MKLMQHCKSTILQKIFFLKKEEAKESFVLSLKNGKGQVPNSCPIAYKLLLSEIGRSRALPGTSSGAGHSSGVWGGRRCSRRDLRARSHRVSAQKVRHGHLGMPAQLFPASGVSGKSSACGPLCASETK